MYVADHVELGYAVTAFRARDATVDTVHAVVTGSGMSRELFYVAMTCGRRVNHAYVAVDVPATVTMGSAMRRPTMGTSCRTYSDVGAVTITVVLLLFGYASLPPPQTGSGSVDDRWTGRIGRARCRLAVTRRHLTRRYEVQPALCRSDCGWPTPGQLDGAAPGGRRHLLTPPHSQTIDAVLASPCRLLAVSTIAATW